MQQLDFLPWWKYFWILCTTELKKISRSPKVLEFCLNLFHILLCEVQVKYIVFSIKELSETKEVPSLKKFVKIPSEKKNPSYCQHFSKIKVCAQGLFLFSKYALCLSVELFWIIQQHKNVKSNSDHSEWGTGPLCIRNPRLEKLLISVLECSICYDYVFLCQKNKNKKKFALLGYIELYSHFLETQSHFFNTLIHR